MAYAWTSLNLLYGYQFMQSNIVLMMVSYSEFSFDCSIILNQFTSDCSIMLNQDL